MPFRQTNKFHISQSSVVSFFRCDHRNINHRYYKVFGCDGQDHNYDYRSFYSEITNENNQTYTSIIGMLLKNDFGFPKVKWLQLTCESGNLIYELLMKIFSRFHVLKLLKSVNF